MTGAPAIRLGVLASGRGSNFAALADAARSGRLGGEVSLLVTDRPDAGALAEARRRSVPALCLDPGSQRTRLAPEAEARYVEALRAHGVRVVLLAGFMRILHATFLDAFPGAVLNIHPSLLPAFPGLEGVRQALDHGVAITGCTVHLVDASLDGGPVLGQAAVPVLPEDDLGSLTARVHEAEHRLYPEVVRRFLTEPFALAGRRVVWGRGERRAWA
jgi:phosphoribosylglycinamide formyltransferase 1